MPYPRSFYKVSFSGILTGTEEIFNFGFHLTTPTSALTNTDWDGIDNTVLTSTAQAMVSTIQQSYMRVPSAYEITSLKVAWIGTDGMYLEAPKEIQITNGQGGVSNQGYAPQLATVVTLIANKWKDPGKYNRFYVPSVALSGEGGRLSATDALGLANGYAGALELIEGYFRTSNDDIRLVAMSNSGSNGSSLEIVQVMVGRVIDTQRRRRNKLEEDYQYSAIDR